VTFTTSVDGIHPSPWLPYGAAKAGLAKVVVDLARQLAAQHIRVNAVAPGVLFGPPPVEPSSSTSQDLLR
jgi:NAD(P)-dependent dehydrogenase (short-subunit alcohol dehydrogenase family)